MCDNTVLEKVTIDGPGEIPNTDGISVSRTNGFKILESIIKTGGPCIKIGDGSKNLHIEGTSCGPGRGFSVGNLGELPKEQPVDGIFVKGCTISNTEDGLRVRTWPGSPPGIATRLHFEDVIMENVRNPIFIDQEYCPESKCNPETNSSRVKISDVLFKGIRGTSSTKDVMTFLCSKAVPCEQVVLQDIDLKYEGSEGGPGAISGCKNVQPKVVGKVEPKPCTAPPDALKKAKKERGKQTKKGTYHFTTNNA
ncbi:hypothetical protein OSB04_030601 [Centaurea solstitialis]|uniref:Polygalacturonase n=1 Tax=Centaurea solstitialis TaxID=347529 RepID=A0AA38S8S8_9ASTR|nr:hypothetical protein OSB04_030601 [Centaurea solstitialis]